MAINYLVFEQGCELYQIFMIDHPKYYNGFSFHRFGEEARPAANSDIVVAPGNKILHYSW